MQRKKKSISLPLSLAFTALTVGQSHAFEFTLSENLDLVEGQAGALHTVRIYALTPGVTNVSVPGYAGYPPINETLAYDEGYLELDLQAGARIVTDKPTAAIKYDAEEYQWDTSLAGVGTTLDTNNKEFFLVLADQDATELSVDLDGDGSAETFTLNSGYGVIGLTGTPKTLSSSNPVHLFGFDTGTSEFDGAYLLVPDSSTYVPLYPVNNLGEDDSETAGPPLAKAGATLEGSGSGWLSAKAKSVLGFIGSLIIPDAHAAPTQQSTTDNGDGTFTFTQKVDESSSVPHYSRLNHGGGFGIYSWYNQDYGWMHNFPDATQPGLQIQSATLTVRAYDVDAEPRHGTGGEYNGITGDGSWLNPQYLQGTNGTWAITNFNVDPSALLDGELDVWVNIDMNHTSRHWATTLDYSQLSVVYSYTSNNAPYSPVLSIAPAGCTYANHDLVANVDGPTPADPDGDTVTYEYRWLVDVGTGSYIDDEFAGRGNHTGNTVSSSDTANNDKWKVEVTPIDSYGARGTKNSVSFAQVGSCNTPPIANAGSNQTVSVDASFTLDGSGSQDADGSINAYRWESYSGGNWTTIGSQETVSYSLASPGTYQFRLTVTDNHGFTDDSLVYITVLANSPPVAEAGQNQSVEQTSPAGAQVTLDGSGSTDPDGDPLTYAWSGPFGSATGVSPVVTMPAGASNANLVVNDGTVDSAADSVIITVTDTTAPVVTAPANVTAEATGPETTVAIGNATATDAVGVVDISSDAPATFPVGTTTVTWTATDVAGNVTTATQTVTVEDTTAPAVTTPANVTVEATGPETTVAIGNATATDAVGVLSLTSDAPATFPVGVTTVTWTATDVVGNVTTATQTVTVEDTTAPAVTTPANVTVEATGPETAAATVAIGEATATDAVGVLSLTSDAPATFPVGVTTVTWTATDAAGNVTTATQTATVEDTTAPAVTTPANVTVKATGPETTVAIGEATATDAVGVVSLTSDAPAPATFPVGSTTVTWTATDAAGNVTTATQVITVGWNAGIMTKDHHLRDLYTYVLSVDLINEHEIGSGVVISNPTVRYFFSVENAANEPRLTAFNTPSSPSTEACLTRVPGTLDYALEITFDGVDLAPGESTKDDVAGGIPNEIHITYNGYQFIAKSDDWSQNVAFNGWNEYLPESTLFAPNDRVGVYTEAGDTADGDAPNHGYNDYEVVDYGDGAQCDSTPRT